MFVLAWCKIFVRSVQSRVELYDAVIVDLNHVSMPAVLGPKNTQCRVTTSNFIRC